MIYLTDYVYKADIERVVLSDNLVTFVEGDVDKRRIEVLLIWHFSVTESVLSEYPNLKAVVRYGVGVDNVDLEACENRSIKVFNNPDYGVDEVSDTAIAMIMALARNIVSYDKRAKCLMLEQGENRSWQENTNGSSKRLSASTLGIVGVGRIGSAVARKMGPIVKNIQVYDPFVSAGYEKSLKVRRLNTLEELLRSSDIVTLHVPLSSATNGMVDKTFISQLKEGAILVNTARGGLIKDLNDLWGPLASRNLSAIGLDVLPDEPPRFDESQQLLQSWLQDDELFEGRIIINPHTSYYSPESFREMRQKAAEIALNALLDKQTLNRVV